MAAKWDSLRGMNLNKMRRRWKEVGGTVSDKNGTGEEVFRHPILAKPITVNKRRKDAPRKLTSALERLQSKSDGELNRR